MDIWLNDVKQLRIPRPKFGISGSPPTSRFVCQPSEPPKDYNMSAVDESTSHSIKTTNELRQRLQDKL